MLTGQYTVDSFLTYTIGILVVFIGVYLNRNIAFLREYNIPEPVSGGLLASLLIFCVYLFFSIETSFELETRDRLLVYFFTCIGLCARVSDLIQGGKPLLLLLAITITYIVLQDAVGMSVASLIGFQPEIGVLAGSASLIGGHGTAIAWAEQFEAVGIDNALEIGVSSATLGLVVASLIGGPIAKYLITKNKLAPTTDEEQIFGVPYSDEKNPDLSLSHLNFLSVILVLHVTIIAGYFLNLMLSELGLKLPLFVASLLMGIIASNTIPRIFKKVRWPARTRAMAVVSDFSLSLFLAMSLMSMQLWTISDLAGPLLLLLAAQTFAAIGFILFVVYPLMGKNYESSVICAGYGGFALGATPTAIANMTAVTKSHGPAPNAFIMLPLVAAFFVDIVNSFVIQTLLTR